MENTGKQLDCSVKTENSVLQLTSLKTHQNTITKLRKIQADVELPLLGDINV